MRLSSLGFDDDGTAFDMLVFSDTPRYITKKGYAQWNGVYGYFGYMTMKINSGMDLKFQIVKSGTNTPMVLRRFYFTLFDLDTGDPNGDQSGGAEIVSAKGYSQYFVTEETELAVSTSDDGKTRFAATVYGTGADNPWDPNHMTQLQQNRAVSFEYIDTSEFYISYDLAPGGGSQGRDVYFAGKSELVRNTCLSGHAGVI